MNTLKRLAELCSSAPSCTSKSAPTYVYVPETRDPGQTPAAQPTREAEPEPEAPRAPPSEPAAPTVAAPLSKYREPQVLRDDTITKLRTRDVIEDTLHVVIMVSNPVPFRRRYVLANQFIERMEREPFVALYIVEIAYGDQEFIVTTPGNPKHLQLRTKVPLWHKESALNIGIRRLLPATWQACAWIDADVQFESHSWALDTLKLLNEPAPVVAQLFSHALDMDANEEPMTIFQSLCYLQKHGIPQGKTGLLYSHPGFGWACNRAAFEKMGGLFELNILGSGDYHVASCILGRGAKSYHGDMPQHFKDAVAAYESRVKGIKLAYVPGVIRHHFHGQKSKRKYVERWSILVKHKYDPFAHVTHDENGLLVPTAACPQKLLDEIMQYFQERDEDEFYKTLAVT